MPAAITDSRNASPLRIAIPTAKKRLIVANAIRNRRILNKTNERSHF